MDSDSRVALAEIRGDVKLVLAGQERTHTDIAAINKRLDDHNGRIGLLETDKNVRDGERKGLGFGGRIAWGIISLVAGSGLGAVTVKLLGG
jgi:hypothetical protein